MVDIENERKATQAQLDKIKEIEEAVNRRYIYVITN